MLKTGENSVFIDFFVSFFQLLNVWKMLKRKLENEYLTVC